jgi:5-dehydro-2-deoxygluconokinase
MGEEGAITLYNNEEIKTGIFPAQAVKPNGAGDSFMAGLLSSLAAGYNLKNSVIRGSACASIVVALPGCAPAMPDEDQLNDYILNNPIKDVQ